jgi:hypothetical protein
MKHLYYSEGISERHMGLAGSVQILKTVVWKQGVSRLGASWELHKTASSLGLGCLFTYLTYLASTRL